MDLFANKIKDEKSIEVHPLEAIQSKLSKEDINVLFPFVESTLFKPINKYDEYPGEKKSYLGQLSLQNYKNIEFTDYGIETCCIETLDLLKSYTSSDDGTLFMADDNTLRRVIHCSEGITHGMKLPITNGTTISAYVANTGKYLCLNRITNIAEDPRCPLGTTVYDDIVKSVLCLPMITEEGKLIAVFEFVKMHHINYIKSDIAFAQGMIIWFAKAIGKKYKRIKNSKEWVIEFHDLLLRIFKMYSSDEIDCDSLISEIMIRTRDYIRAKEIQFFVPVNKEKRELYFYEEGLIGKRKLYRKKLPLQLEDDLLLMYAWDNNKYLNVSGEDLKNFNITDPKIKSILCVPIGSKTNVFVIVKAINKFKGKFDIDDAVEIRHSAIFCALAYKHHKSRQNYQILKQVVKSKQKKMVYYSMGCEHDINTFVNQALKTPLPDNIFSFTWYPNQTDLGLLSEYTWWMFRHLFKYEKFFEKFPSFLLAIRHGYRSKPYHNFEHAFGVMHIIFVIIHLHPDEFSMFEKICLMLGGLCHDINHPGISNIFLHLSKDPMAELYPQSTLENHHSYMARLLIDSYGLFSHLPDKEALKYKKEIHELIMNTHLDLAMAVKFPLLQKILEEKTFDETKHRYLLKSLIMTTADVAGQGKNLDVSGRLTALWKDELYIEGDRYKKLGIAPNRKNDREFAKQIPEDQVNFLTYICEGCSDMLSRLLPKVRILYRHFKHVRKEWAHTIGLIPNVQEYINEYTKKPKNT